MALADGISFIAASGGTGTFVFGSARASFLTLAQALALGEISNGQTVSYLAQDSLSSPLQREWGHGTYSSTGSGSVARTTVLGTVNNGVSGSTALNFTVPPIVSLTALAEDILVSGGALGTPSSGTLTNATGLPVSTGISGLGTGVATALGDNVGSTGAFVTNGGVLGTPLSGTLTNATGLPISTGVSGLGTGVATALGDNVGSAGAFVTNGGALGTPSSGTLTNATGLPISTGVSGLGTNVAADLANNVNAANGMVTQSNISTSWTPTDASGASLTFSTANGNYTVIGNMVFAYFDIQWPSTANGSSAKIGGLPVTSANLDTAIVCMAVAQSGAAGSPTIFLEVTQNGTTANLINQAFSAITNATMSTAEIRGILIYPKA